MSFNCAIDKTIETLCEQGCRVVLQTIEAFDRGEEVAEISSFNGPERDLILNELREIMAVYEFRDCALPTC